MAVIIAKVIMIINDTGNNNNGDCVNIGTDSKKYDKIEIRKVK